MARSGCALLACVPYIAGCTACLFEGHSVAPINVMVDYEFLQIIKNHLLWEGSCGDDMCEFAYKDDRPAVGSVLDHDRIYITVNAGSRSSFKGKNQSKIPPLRKVTSK